MSDRLHVAICHAMRVIVGGDVQKGIQSILDFMEILVPGDITWQELRSFDFVADAARIESSLATHIETAATFSHYYFGLDHLNMPKGKGIEFGCGEAQDNFTKYLGRIPSRALAKIFSACEENPGQYALGLGFLGLALYQAFKSLAPSFPGAQKPRKIIFGFGGGDIFPLGAIHDGRFQLELPDEYLKDQSKPPSPKDLTAIWPHDKATEADWFFAAARAASQISDRETRHRKLSGHLARLRGLNRAREALPFVEDMLKEEDSIPRPYDRVQLQVLAATLFSAVHERERATRHLAAASTLADQITYDYWREQAKRNIFEAAQKAGSEQEFQSPRSPAASPNDGAPTPRWIRDLMNQVTGETTEPPLEFARRTLGEIAREDTLTRTGGFHHLMTAIEAALLPLLKSKDYKGFFELLPQVRAIFRGWPMERGGMICASVHNTFAKMLILAGLKQEAMTELEAALSCAKKEAVAASRASALQSIAEVYASQNEWESAMAALEHTRDPASRREAMVLILLAGERWEELLALVRRVRDPFEASELATRVAWHF